MKASESLFENSVAPPPRPLAGLVQASVFVEILSGYPFVAKGADARELVKRAWLLLLALLRQ